MEPEHHKNVQMLTCSRLWSPAWLEHRLPKLPDTCIKGLRGQQKCQVSQQANQHVHTLAETAKPPGAVLGERLGACEGAGAGAAFPSAARRSRVTASLIVVEVQAT